MSFQASKSQYSENPKNRVQQTDGNDILPKEVRISESVGAIRNKRHSNDIIQKDYTSNPRTRTTYQIHFNDMADLRLGFCDNKSIEERHRYFKGCQRLQDCELQNIKLRNASSAGKYKSNKARRISEYMAETSHIGGVIMKSGIHNHLKCRNRNCSHFITFR